ncbi:MAG: hypothetical protein EOL93_01825 [Epsilonproteobacteria bacterium]|nr:hypothetical protein [Campylobacterota bacterium]
MKMMLNAGGLGFKNCLCVLIVAGTVYTASHAGQDIGVSKYQVDRISALSRKIEQLEKQIVELKESHKKEIAAIKKTTHPRKLTVTAYSNTRAQCDSDPNVTASMTKPRPGIIAVSRDLFNQGWVFGRRVHIEGLGIYEIADLMSKKHKNRIDVFIGHEKKASEFGKRNLTVALLPNKKS